MVSALVPAVGREQAIHDSPLDRNRVVLELDDVERNIRPPIPAVNSHHWNHIADAAAERQEREDVPRAARVVLPAVGDE